MAEKFLTIVITSPEAVEREAEKIARLLDSGVDFVHIRKPDWSLQDVRHLIEDIPYRLRNRLRLHGHFALHDEMNLAGVHLNSRCPQAPANAATATRSCHGLDEIAGCDKMAYVTLSPIFDSISKSGYKSRFDIRELSSAIAGKRVVALGGVTPENIKELRDAGFFGAALLGYIWEGNFEDKLQHLMERLHEELLQKMQ